MDTSAVGLESGPVGETNVITLIGMPDSVDFCVLQMYTEFVSRNSYSDMSILLYLLYYYFVE